MRDRENQYVEKIYSRFSKNTVFVMENTIIYMFAWDFYRIIFDSESTVVTVITDIGGYFIDIRCSRAWNDCGLWKV